MNNIAEYLTLILFVLLLVLYFIYFYASITKFTGTNVIYLLLLGVVVLFSFYYLYLYVQNQNANKNFLIAFPIFAFFILYVTFDITVKSDQYKHKLLMIIVTEFVLLIILELLFYNRFNQQIQ